MPRRLAREMHGSNCPYNLLIAKRPQRLNYGTMKHNRAHSPSETDATGNRDFHVVGVGASAGGLEAIEALFQHMPLEIGVAFVVVQHLSPDFKSHMEELIARKTRIPVHLVEDKSEVHPNAIYLLPARMEMVIADGKLLLTERSPDRSFAHPIDQFFRSLAHDCGRRSIAIILSGTGSDGARGVREIHDAGGLVMIQDPQSAKFDGMPLSAQATGVVDLAVPPEQMADVLLRYSQQGVARDQLAGLPSVNETPLGIDCVFNLLHQHYGIDFSQYKSSTVGRRLQRRMDLLNINSVDEYVEYLPKHRAELNELYRDLLIGVTKFFRDPEAYATLAREIIPKIFNRIPDGQTVRTWVAGCASGEEAYSIAMLLDEERKRRGASVDIKVFATDAHPTSIQTAARGIYGSEEISHLSDERRQQYFRRERDGYQVTPELRQLLVFAAHNVLNDAPFTQMDLVTCRNLLIYFQPAAQAKALSLFHFALKSGGTLFLGPSESTGDLSDEFQVMNPHWRVYVKRRDLRMPIGSTVSMSQRLEGPRLPLLSDKPRASRIDANLINSYDELLSQKMGSSILVDRRGNILHIFGGAERCLRFATGRPSNQILEAVHDDLRPALSAAMQHVSLRGEAVQYAPLQFDMGKGKESLRIEVEPIGDSITGLGNMLVLLKTDEAPHEEASVQPESSPQQHAEPPTDAGAQRVVYLESELQHSKEKLKELFEEMETANEELQASNEELIASNEELQSTNEELHSVNEELYTVNAEHQRRAEELAEANADMDNLLATTRVGVVFLDQELCVRRYTPQIAELLRISDQDIGRPIEHYAHRLCHASLIENLHEVLDSRSEFETKIKDISGNPYLLRIVPYRFGAESQGVVLTLIDITRLTAAEVQLERFKFMTETASDLIILATPMGKFLYVNPATCEALGYARDELCEMSFNEVECELQNKEIIQLYETSMTSPVRPIQSEWRRKDGSRLPVEISVSSVEIDGEYFLSANVRDITERRAAEIEMRLQHLAIESTLNGIVITDPHLPDNPITYANPGFLRLTGYARDDVLGRNCRFLQGPESRPEVKEEIRAAIEKGLPCRVSIRNYREDGSLFWNDLQITPVYDSRNRLVNFVGVQNDITERMQIQEALEIGSNEARAASEAKSSFMANMSHELRTPMTAVLGFADMLSEELSHPPHREMVLTIKRNGEYLLALLNDILDLSKVEAGKMEIHQQQLDVRRLVEDVQALMEVRALEEGIPLHFEWEKEVPTEVTADQIRVRQILVNLIGNALKFTDEGTVRVVIGMDRETSPPRLTFTIHDTGIGIHDSHLPELFMPFSQSGVQRRRRFGGTGLGLSISKRLAEGMGGEIAVQSELGVGSSFTFSLPLNSRQVEQCQAIGIRREQTNTAVPRYHLPAIDARVLLADDRRDIWRVGKYFLEKCGASVTVVEDGLQAVEETQRALQEGRPFELILMDMQMPVMTGREAIAEIRQMGVAAPIIALTADAMEGERDACIEMGCDDYFPKPIDGTKLMNLVAFHLEK